MNKLKAKTQFGVHYRAEIIGRDGRVRKTQSGENLITDWGMNALAANTILSLVAYLHLSSSLGPAKRSATGGITLTIDYSDMDNIAVTASAGFFESTDAGQTLWINDLGQELLISTYNSSTSVTCATRCGQWLPSVGDSPSTGPYSTYSVQPTNTSTLADDFTAFNTSDTGSSNYDNVLNDSANLRWNTQRIFLSSAVTGSAWTVNQLGWGNSGTTGGNVFGWVNLASPDTVAVGEKYRVTLNVYSSYLPINLSDVTIDFGDTVGSYTMDIRQEVIPSDANSNSFYNFQCPYLNNSNWGLEWWTSGFTVQATAWEGDSGYVPTPHKTGSAGSSANSKIVTSSYTSNTHCILRTLTFSDADIISGAIAFIFSQGSWPTNSGSQPLTFTLVSGAFTKPEGWLCTIPWTIFWTRSFTV